MQDKIYTYEYIDRQATKVANLALSLGLKQKDTVALLLFNGPEFIWTFFGKYYFNTHSIRSTTMDSIKIVIVNFVFIAGLSKIGVEVAFLNYNMRSKSLLHCFNVSGAKFLIVGKGK